MAQFGHALTLVARLKTNTLLLILNVAVSASSATPKVS
jgi:hypothetical protein